MILNITVINDLVLLRKSVKKMRSDDIVVGCLEVEKGTTAPGHGIFRKIGECHVSNPHSSSDREGHGETQHLKPLILRDSLAQSLAVTKVSRLARRTVKHYG